MIEILGIFYGLCFTACYVPQLVKTLRTKSVGDLSLKMYFLCILGYVSGLLYFIASGTMLLGAMVNLIGGLIPSIWQIILILKYREPKIKN